MANVEHTATTAEELSELEAVARMGARMSMLRQKAFKQAKGRGWSYVGEEGPREKSGTICFSKFNILATAHLNGHALVVSWQLRAKSDDAFEQDVWGHSLKQASRRYVKAFNKALLS